MTEGFRMAGFRRLVLMLLLLGIVAVGAIYAFIPTVQWRVDVLVLKATGKISDISVRELVHMMAPGSGFYLESLAETHNPFSAIVNPFDDLESVRQGGVLFGSLCVSCHGTEGNGGSAPALSAGNLKNGDSDWALYRVIRDGIPSTAMPNHSSLSELDLWHIVAHVRTLQSAKVAVAARNERAVAPVTQERLLKASQAEPGNWLTYSGAYDGSRYSQLDQINRDNAKHVRIEWIHQFAGTERIVETSPIVNNGVMYVTEPPSIVHALDAATGTTLWSYTYRNAGDVSVCCGLVNRGVAVHEDTVFLATLDDHLVALNATDGTVRWIVELEDYRHGASVTAAPLVVGDKVIVGYGGGDMGIRGFVDAISAKDGSRVWRFYTVPAPGEPGNETWSGDSWKRGGAATWLTGVYDPTLNLIYWTTGNPAPDYQGESREGDNLYSCSVVALDADTGKLRWHFQFTPHDERDWDSNQMPVLVDLPFKGDERKLMLFANRNGFYYVLDRQTGEFLVAEPFAKQNWAKGIDPKGRPIPDMAARPSVAGVATWPSPIGAMSWQSPTYSLRQRIIYLPALEWGQIVYKDVQAADHSPGEYYLGGGHEAIPSDKSLYFAVRAIDPTTGKRLWEHKNPMRDNWWKTGGLVSTAGDIVFGGDNTDLFILDATSGSELWRMNVGGQINAAPIAYAVNGRQMFTLAAGRSIVTVGLP
jgi:alcohol dehydrogenase (cytochrome c)